MGLAPAQQPQPASTKKDKSRELTAALRNACASVHSSVCAGGQLGSTTLSPQAAAAAPRRRWHPTLSTCSGGDPQHCFGPSMTVLGQGIPCSSLALHMPGSCRWTGCPCLAMLQLLFLAGDQAPDHMTASGWGWLNIQLIRAPCPARLGSSTTAVLATPRAGSEGQCAPSVLHPMLVGSGWVVLS